MTGPADTPNRALCGARYRILGPIATGGMAEVLEGEDTILGRTVAIKVLKRPARRDAEELDGDEAAEVAHLADRMRVEARALALVAHPNIVAVIDLGTTTDGRPFIVTERLLGRSLDAELRERGFLPWVYAVEVVLAVLAALEAVHAKGIVHRDLKPGNVFLCEDGSVKLLDFGVAKILGAASTRHVAPAYRTKEGSMVGTPKYITPEQAFGEPVDARTDLFAVGLLTYALITGRHAFDGQDLLRSVTVMRDEGAVPPSRHASQAIPPALDRAVVKALAWSPSDRFQSAAALAEALRASRAPTPHGDGAAVPLPAAASRGLSRPAFVLIVAMSAVLVFVALLLSTGGAG